MFQPEISIALTEQDELFTAIEFAAGNGLNEISPFNLAPWAAPLEDDVKDINGRNRDYLLTAWYAHTFELSEENTLQLGGGNLDIDSTQVAEAYGRFVLNDYFALTLDVQYMRDKFVEGDGPKGFIIGARGTVEF